MAEIAQLQKEKEVEAEEERQKQMLEAPVTTSFDLFSFDTDDDSFLTLCGYYYTFSRVTSKPDFKDAIIGRWGLSGHDQVFDINADGTYTRYDSRDSYSDAGCETFQVGISGTWELDGTELIFVSDPAKSIVNAYVSGPSPYAPKSLVDRRNAELKRIAAQKQVEHRKQDRPSSTISTITRIEENSFKARMGSEINSFYRLRNN